MCLVLWEVSGAGTAHFPSSFAIVGHRFAVQLKQCSKCMEEKERERENTGMCTMCTCKLRKEWEGLRNVRSLINNYAQMFLLNPSVQQRKGIQVDFIKQKQPPQAYSYSLEFLNQYSGPRNPSENKEHESSCQSNFLPS